MPGGVSPAGEAEAGRVSAGGFQKRGCGPEAMSRARDDGGRQGQAGTGRLASHVVAWRVAKPKQLQAIGTGGLRGAWSRIAKHGRGGWG